MNSLKIKINKFSFQIFSPLLLLSIVLITSNLKAEDFFNISLNLDSFSSKFLKEKESKFKFFSEHQDFSVISNSFQQVLSFKRNKKGVNLVLKVGQFKKLARKKEKPLKIYLEDTPFLNLTNPRVKKIASSFNKIKNKDNLLFEVEKFVYNYIQKKSYGIPLISASDILQSRSGDCTEHSVLAVSLLRALKIPARALFGLVYEKKYQAQKNIFIFHMWVEAYYQKKWNLIDATRSGAKKLNHYLALGYHDLQTATPLSYLKTMATIQNLKISYVP